MIRRQEKYSNIFSSMRQRLMTLNLSYTSTHILVRLLIYCMWLCIHRFVLLSDVFSRLIKSYTDRIKFCLAGSKRTFGLVKGSSVAVIVDTSDANTGFDRLSALKTSLVVN